MAYKKQPWAKWSPNGLNDRYSADQIYFHSEQTTMESLIEKNHTDQNATTTPGLWISFYPVSVVSIAEVAAQVWRAEGH